jgi:hypothetical protein
MNGRGWLQWTATFLLQRPAGSFTITASVEIVDRAPLFLASGVAESSPIAA